MSLANTSQLLIRNLVYLNATHPLFINMPADALFTDYCATYPNAKPTSVHFYYDDYIAIAEQYKNQVEVHFTVHYQSTSLHDLVVIQFPKTKAELVYTLAMLTGLLTEQAQVLFVGDNKSGIKSVDKIANSYVSNIEKIDNARHCLLYAGQIIAQPTAFCLSDWFNYYSVEIDDIHIKVAALPGVFSHNRLDIGTQVLLSSLPTKLSGTTLDFGCGAGVISAFMGVKYANLELTLLDVNSLAIASAQKTLSINNLDGTVIPSNGLQQVKGTFQHIVSNPPFHQGIKTNYHTTELFIAGINQHLTKSGSAFIVANSFLQYQPIMERYLTKVQRIKQQHGFTVYQCQHNNKN